MKNILLLFICLLFLLCGCDKPSESLPPENTQKQEPVLWEAEKSFVEETKGLYLAPDGNIISVFEPHEDNFYTDDFDRIEKFANDSTLPVYIAFPPRKMDALTNSFPESFSDSHSQYIYSLAKERVGNGVYIDLYGALKGKSAEAGDLYFMTDHHWTQKGAWMAYCEILKQMGEVPLKYEWFSEELLLENFGGSDLSKAKKAGHDVSSQVLDTISGAVPDGLFITESVSQPYDSDENTIKMEGFYDREKLSGWEPYEVFLGGNKPYVRIYSPDSERKTLILIRDSFANALSPFLAAHYDLVLIDPRFYPDKISTVAEREQAFAVLILENMGSVSEGEVKLRW